jgi:ribonuclease HI
MSTNSPTYDTGSEIVDGVVFYTDGGNRPSGKYLGWGVHGYAYKDIIPKKGSGNTLYYPSSFGYVSKSDRKEGTVKTEITPINYFDGYGCTQEFGSNNLAEVLAAKLATEKAIDIAPKKLLIRTDSEYLIKGSTDWSHSWVRNGWKRADGSVVPNADHWKQLLKNYQLLRDSNCDIKIEWVKGHSDHLGNNLADKLATTGVMASANGESREQFNTSPPEGYWKSNVDKHPFFHLKYLYFITNKEFLNKGEYFICNQVKDLELHGKRQSDASYSVVQLKEPEYMVEFVREHHAELAGDFDHTSILRLDQLFKSDVYRAIESYGKNALVRKFTANQHRLSDLNTLDGEPLTHTQNPPRISQRTLDRLRELKDILENFKNNTGTDKLTSLDITDYFFEKKSTVKKKETITEFHLKSEINSNFTSLPLIINIDGKDTKIIISLGIDLPSRNSLKAMENSDLKISLLYWKPNDKVVRYGVCIKHNDDWGIWSGFDSNIVFLK